MADAGSVAGNRLWITLYCRVITLFSMVYVTFLDDICHYYNSGYACRMLAIVDLGKMTIQIKSYFNFML